MDTNANTSLTNGRVRRGSFALIGAALLVLIWCAWSRRWISDDGFIYLRVVQNLRAGHGPVFNQGERVEAATGPAWTYILAFFDLVTPLRLEWIAVLLGIGFTVGGCVAAAMGATVLQRDVLGSDALLVPFGLAIVVAIPAVWDYATSGLETGLALAWVGVTFLLLMRWVATPTWQDTKVPAGVAIAVGFGSLVRPDFLLFTLAFGVVLLIPRVGVHATMQRVRVIAIALALPVAYEVFRAGYYGALVPNSAFAKEGSTLRVGQGLRYARDFVGSYWLFIPMTIALIVLVGVVARLHRAPTRGPAAVVVASVAAGLLDAAYTIGIGGSHMHARLFLPALLACLAPVAVIPWAHARLLIMGVFAWSVVCAVSLRPPKITATQLQDGVVDLRSGFIVRYHNPVTVQSHIATTPPEQRQVVSTPRGKVVVPFGLPGAVAYYEGPSVYVFDDFGLADWLTARLPLNPHGFPDHQKNTGKWLAARLSLVTGRPPHADDFTSLAGVRALSCGDLRDLRDATTDHLDAHRFLENLGVAIRLQTFRLPADPRVAEHRLCR